MAFLVSEFRAASTCACPLSSTTRSSRSPPADTTTRTPSPPSSWAPACTNAAYVESAKAIAKLEPSQLPKPSNTMVINTECGSFDSPCLPTTESLNLGLRDAPRRDA
ncbi:hypothetical protein E2562_035934 [Oryza meyeriana var. granulata]|uniref:hexokinase n=1 Tax=Oryza meyeriana var. granulata TaxID=110450 RepID=A0A6G1DTE7_9ORYZ|nr:hypothetical protein E2562_035934 [Oryza meyeriana var. granulata]